MIPLPNPLTQPLHHPPRPLEILRLEIDLPAKSNPPRSRIEHNSHKRMMILDHGHNQPLRHRRRILFPDLPPRIPNLQRQPHIRKETFRQAPPLVIQHLRLQDVRDRDAARLDDIGAIAHDLLLAAADFLAELESLGDAQIRRVVNGADELELLDELALGAWRERVIDLGLAGDGVGFEAVGGGQGGADQVLVLDGDVEDGAAAGDEEPSSTTR